MADHQQIVATANDGKRETTNNLKTIILLIALLSFSFARDIPNDNKIQGRLNIINGASAECVMHYFYTSTGWTKIEGEIGRNGIDGLYYKIENNIIKDVLVAESKWNTSRLGKSGKNKTIKQMSQEWIIKTLDKLLKKDSSKIYKTIKTFIDNNQYRARIFRLKPKGDDKLQITIYKVKNKNTKAFDEFKDSNLKEIDINKPRNSFEKNIIKAYNSCRIKQLHKYLDILTKKEIDSLMHDNYIQKKDIKLLLK
jgi:hypothetical protein